MSGGRSDAAARERERLADEVIAFWVDETGPEGWYAGDEALDGAITARFGDAAREACEEGPAAWLTGPRAALAFLILVDQFPRNIHRGEGAAFACDDAARCAAKHALARGWDKEIGEPERQFFYLPLMHSESVADQERGVRLIMTRMRETGESNLLHARAHREVIRRYGRFPYRNAALGRKDTAAEAAFLDAGGYGAVLREMQGETA